MGWLAAGCCTLFAGYVLYNFYVRGASDRSVRPQFGVHPTSSPITPKASAPLLSTPSLVLGVPTIGTADTKTRDVGMPEISAGNETTTYAKPQLPTVARPSSPPRLKAPSFGSMPAPPRPGNGLMRPPPSAAASLRVPPQKALPNTSMAPTSSIMPPGKQVSRKVILEPGHSPLDWAALTADPNARLRGKDVPDHLIKVTSEQLKKQNGRKGKDAWTVYNGKVYNISPYVPFHPGGAGELLRGAGKDSVKLFMEVHPWVNWDGMLSECLVGILVGTEDEGSSGTNNLDDMD